MGSLGAEGGRYDWSQQSIRALLLVLVGFLCIMTSLHIGQWLGDFVNSKMQRRSDQEAVEQSQNPRDMGLPLAQGQGPVPEVSKPLYQREKSLFYWTVVLALWSGAAIVYFPAISKLEDADDA